MSRTTREHDAAVMRRRSVLRAIEAKLDAWDAATLPGHPLPGAAGAKAPLQRLIGVESLIRYLRADVIGDLGDASEEILLALAGNALLWLEAQDHANETNPAAGDPA